MSKFKGIFYEYLVNTLEIPLKIINNPHQNIPTLPSSKNIKDTKTNNNSSASPINTSETNNTKQLSTNENKINTNPNSNLSPSFEQQYDSFKEKIFKCDKCFLHKNRTNQILNQQNINTPLMILSDFPSHYDQIQGKYMSENYGLLFERMLSALGFSLNEVYLSSVLKCHSPIELLNKLDQLGACEQHLREEFSFLPNLKFILGFGETTYQYLFKNKDFEKNRGQILTYQNKKILFTYHPKELHNNPLLKEKSWKEDLKPNLKFFH